MQIAAETSFWKSTRAMARAVLRIVARILIAFAALMTIAVVLPNRNLMAWTFIVCFSATAGLFPISVLVRRRFGRMLRRDHPELAVKMGLGGKIDWRHARSVLDLEFLDAFLKRGGHRDFANRDLRFAADTYIWVTRLGITVASLMIGSIPAAIVALTVLGQHAP